MTHDVFSAFGNRTRAKLIICLGEKKKNVSELIRTCGLSQSAVSQHLCKLRQAGIVKTEKDGKEVWYSLKYRKTADISRMLLSLDKEVS